MPDTSPSSRPTTHRVEVPVAADRAELVAAALWARGAAGVWERAESLVAWFTAGEGAGAPALEASGIPELAAERLTWRIEPDRDWQAEWKATIAPVRAGRVVVVPTWLADEHEPAADERTLVLDPGRAFGSGHHATTTLCLELLDELDRAGAMAGRTLADIGCGTGVLAIAAASWGAIATAVDIDPTAIEVTDENAARNDVEVTAFPGSVEDLTGPVEIVVANLVTDVIVALARPLVDACTSTLLVSGIATERRARALDALEAAGATTRQVVERDGWVAALLTTSTAGADPTAAGATS